MSASLHQLAQPLSIIQGSLELALLQKQTGEPFRKVAESTLLQVRRTVDILAFTSQLTRYQQPATDVTSVAVSSVLDEVITDLKGTLSSAQINLVVDRPGHEREIQFSPIRLRQLFFYSLQAAQQLSRPGETLHIEVRPRPGRVELRISQHPGNKVPDALPEFNRDSIDRALSLAKAIASCAGADFNVSYSPLVMIVDFSLRNKGGSSVSEKNKFAGAASAQIAAGLR